MVGFAVLRKKGGSADDFDDVAVASPLMIFVSPE
jgi:hypothetical protein